MRTARFLPVLRPSAVLHVSSLLWKTFLTVSILHLLLLLLVSTTTTTIVTALSTPTPPSSTSTTPGTSRQRIRNQQPQSQRITQFPNSIPIVLQQEEEEEKEEYSDIDVFIRQTGQIAPARAAIGIPKICACRHGFPQAFAMDPFHGGRINSGLLKLTCPLLVRGIDQLEDDGYIQQVNQHVQLNKELQSDICQTHEIHATGRKALLHDPNDREIIQSKLGTDGCASFLDAGVAGAANPAGASSSSSSKSSSSGISMDVKCLHAWLADALFRGSAVSPLGDDIVSYLQNDYNISLEGTVDCHKLCDPTSSELPDPPKPRNKQRLKTSKEIERRQRKRKKTREEETND